ncbi:hypothetical protein BDZ91DRAFT_712462 [Kalaharituber pfeilii]|nr:hypothetical protein BDZ91DRAFT_712462 [Kalaharituber pfeilii]
MAIPDGGICYGQVEHLQSSSQGWQVSNGSRCRCSGVWGAAVGIFPSVASLIGWDVCFHWSLAVAGCWQRG